MTKENESLNSKLNKLKQLNPVLVDLEDQLEALKKQKNAAEMRVYSLEADIESRNVRIKELKEELANPEDKEKIQYLLSEIEQSRANHLKTHEVLRTLENKLRDASAKIESERAASIESLRKFEVILEKKSKEMEEVVLERKYSEFNKADYENRVKELHIKIMKLENELLSQNSLNENEDEIRLKEKEELLRLTKVVKIQNKERKQEVAILNKKLTLAEAEAKRMRQLVEMKEKETEFFKMKYDIV